jgi:hypothetical protein
VSISTDDGRSTSHFACRFFAPASRQFPTKRLHREYALWGDPFYPDQILLGAPRTYELAAAFKW